jgi:hypothetical protein
MEVGSQAKFVGHFSPDFFPRSLRSLTPAWRGAPLRLTEETKSGAQRACSLRPRYIGVTRTANQFTSTSTTSGKAFSIELSKTYEILIKTKDRDILLLGLGTTFGITFEIKFK